MTDKSRPEVLMGHTYKLRTENGNFYLTINYDEGKPYEIIMRMGKPGTMIRTMFENLSLWWSILLQNIPESKMIRLLKKHAENVVDDNPLLHKGEQYRSVIDFTAQAVLKEFQKAKEKDDKAKEK